MKNIILIPGTAEGTQAFNPAELDLFRDENGDVDRFKLLTYAMLSKSAKNTAQSMFPNDVTNDGPRNAFQHTYWNALLVGQFGSEFTEAITNAHEQNFDAVRETQFMDLHNNELGRNIATANPGLTGMALIAQVYVAVVGGQAIALNKNKNRFDVYFSNECPAC